MPTQFYVLPHGNHEAKICSRFTKDKEKRNNGYHYESHQFTKEGMRRVKKKQGHCNQQENNHKMALVNPYLSKTILNINDRILQFKGKVDKCIKEKKKAKCKGGKYIPRKQKQKECWSSYTYITQNRL